MNSKILMVIVVIVIAGGAFFGGIQYQKSQIGSFAGGQSGAFRQRMGQTAAFRPVRGNILSIDSNTMTVKLQDGSAKIVILSGSTTYMKEAPSAVGDLKAGDMVMVTGTSNSDGSVTAQSVQSGNVLPVMRATPQAAQ